MLQSINKVNNEGNKDQQDANLYREIKHASPRELQVLSISQRHYLSGGKLIQWSGPFINIEAPFLLDGKKVPLGCHPDLGANEALKALDDSYKAYDHGLGEWPSATPAFRIKAIEKLIDDITLEREAVSRMIMLETAKTLSDSYNEFDRTIRYCRDTVQAYVRLLDQGATVRKYADGLEAYIDRTPLGVTLCMGPFNYPFNETMTTLIPAILTGNTAILKPARFGVLLFEPLLKAFKDNLLPGVVNIIYGDGKNVITPIMKSGKIDALAFIGSSKVANLICAEHPAPHRLTKILGLGAHNYSIILPDADLDKIMPETIKGSISNNGLRCTTLALHFPHESIAYRYAKRLAEEVSKLKPGLPWEEGVKVTHLVEGAGKIEYMQGLIADALDKGAKIMNPNGGKVLGHNQMFPVVLYPVTPDMRIFNEEQFGPIIPVASYRDTKDILRTLAESNLGQQLSIFGGDEEKLLSLAVKARNLVGRVNINSQSQRGPDDLPFAARKDSGLGVLSVDDALLAFTLPTVFAVKRGK